MKEQSSSPEIQNPMKNTSLKFASIVGAGALMLTGCSMLGPSVAECDARPEPAESFSVSTPISENWAVCS